MKKTISIVLILAALAMATGAVMYFLPKEVAMNAQGIQYRLGDEAASLEQPLNVRIEGKIYKSITGQQTLFKGIVDLEGLEIPIPENQRKLEISFDKHNRGMLQYSDIQNGMALPHFVGELYVNKDFSEVAIALLDHEEGRGGGWSGDSGAMIAAPASSRREALEVSNALMSPALDGYTLR